MKTNQELLDEANKIDFRCRKDGTIEGRVHSKYERGLFFVKNSLIIHGMDKYQYGRIQYVDNATNAEIICPLHGSFFQAPKTHISGHGCPKCALNHNYTTEEWVKLAKKTHGNVYDYSSTEYKNNATKVEIVCPTHGSFKVKPVTHTSGHGCPKCAGVHNYTTEEWVKLAKKTHGNTYDYARVSYKNTATKVEIVCPTHGLFMQEPRIHLSLHGCPKCAGHNHDILYLLKCNDTGWYKIGITTRSTKRRIRQIGGNIEEILHVICDDPRKHETHLHRTYVKDREHNLCVDEGNTEFFSLNEDQVAEVRQYMASIAIN